MNQGFLSIIKAVHQEHHNGGVPLGIALPNMVDLPGLTATHRPCRAEAGGFKGFLLRVKLLHSGSLYMVIRYHSIVPMDRWWFSLAISKVFSYMRVLPYLWHDFPQTMAGDLLGRCTPQLQPWSSWSFPYLEGLSDHTSPEPSFSHDLPSRYIHTILSYTIHFCYPTSVVP